MLTKEKMDEMAKLQKKHKDEVAQKDFHKWYDSLTVEDKSQFDKYQRKNLIIGVGFIIGIILLSASCMFGLGRGDQSVKSTKNATHIETQAQKEQEKAQAEAEKKAQAEQAAKAKEKATSAINQAVGDTIVEFKNPQNYPLVKDVSIKVDHDKKEVTMALVVNPATNKKAALDMADTLIRRYSSNVVIHDSSFTMPTKDSYGSLFDTYNISIGVAPAQYVGDRSKWLYDQYITAGMHTKQGPDWKNAK